MTFRRKNYTDKPTRKAAKLAFEMQKPLDQAMEPVKRKGPRRWVEDELPDLGEKK